MALPVHAADTLQHSRCVEGETKNTTGHAMHEPQTVGVCLHFVLPLTRNQALTAQLDSDSAKLQVGLQVWDHILHVL